MTFWRREGDRRGDGFDPNRLVEGAGPSFINAVTYRLDVRRALRVDLSAHERTQLEAWSSSDGGAERLAKRAQIVLQAERGLSNVEIGAALHVDPGTVAKWRQRFVINRLDAIRREAPRAGRSRKVPWSTVERILETSQSSPPAPGLRWTRRSLARQLSVSHMLVHRVWKAYRIEPGSSTVRDWGTGEPDPRKFIDLVGVYYGREGGAAMFEVGVSPDVVRSYLLPDLPRSDLGISGGIHTDGRSIVMDHLIPLMQRLEEERRWPGGPSTSSTHDLLIFLRTMDYVTAPTSDIWIVLKRPDPKEADSLQAWLRQHPRFRVLSVSPSGSWPLEVRRWVQQWSRSRLHAESFRSSGACHASLARLLSTTEASTVPFAWAPTFDSLRGWGSHLPGGSLTGEIYVTNPKNHRLTDVKSSFHPVKT